MKINILTQCTISYLTGGHELFMSGYKEKEKNWFASRFIPSKNDSKSELTRKIITIIAAITLVVSLCILASYLIEQERNRQLVRDLASQHESQISVITQMVTTTAPPETETEVTTTEPPPLVLLDNMQSFIDDNPDTAGWITVGGTSINNVVMQTTDNEYYLERNFYGNYSQPGTVFADFRCIVNDHNFKQSDNIILYGHNQKDGTMFGTLKKYKVTHQNTKNFDFYLEHPTFTFSNLYEEYTYKIVAMFIIEVLPEQTRDGNVFDYHNFVRFKEGTRPFDTFKENILARTAIDTGVDFEYGDKFMTLSTCSNEFEPSRFVVIGRRVREGEDPNVDTSAAVLNEDAIEPDLDYIYSR